MVLGKGTTNDINDRVGAQEKITINFSKTKKKFCLRLHCNGDETYLYVNKTKICKFKANDYISWYNVFLRKRIKGFCKRWKGWSFFK